MRIILTVFLSAMLGGCASWFGEHEPIHNNAKSYQTANSVAPLNLPQGVHLSGVQSAYPVPENRPQWTGQPNLEPPGYS